MGAVALVGFGKLPLSGYWLYAHAPTQDGFRPTLEAERGRHRREKGWGETKKKKKKRKEEKKN